MKIHNIYIFLATVTLLTVSSSEGNSDHADGGCCRRPVECFECDSRFDSRCGDPFNLTRETGTKPPLCFEFQAINLTVMIFFYLLGPVKYCNDLCFKLKHKVGDKYYYIRSCADTLKKLYIKKTDVCYLTRSKDDGHLCFCDQELCNDAAVLSVWLPLGGYAPQGKVVVYAAVLGIGVQAVLSSLVH
jgi:hypothetical protein